MINRRPPITGGTFVDGSVGPELVAAQRARSARLLGEATDAVPQTLQKIPARMCTADVDTPQRFARGGPLEGLADATVGVEVAYPHLPGRLPGGALPMS